MRAVFSRLEELLHQGRKAALLVVTGVPRGLPSLTGARFIVTDEAVDGSTAPDWLVAAAASCGREALQTGRGGLIHHRQQGAEGGELTVDFYVDLLETRPALIIFGGGHISLALTEIGALAGFFVTVVDDRPAFANRERFPRAERVICQDFNRALAEMPITPNSYVVIVTRGHQHDAACLRGVLRSSAAYIGMIGSRRKVKGMYDYLIDQGEPEELLAGVCAPIGLDIGAQTPEEIAVSIMAEVINVRRGGQAAGTSLKRMVSLQ